MAENQEKQQNVAPATSPRAVAWDPFGAMRGEINRVFERFGAGNLFEGAPFGDWSASGALTPSVDVHESDKELTISAELPGMSEADIDVAFRDGMLTIKGEKRYERKDEAEAGKAAHLVERRYGAFQRSFRLPDNVDAEKIAARFEQGVLTISAPKTKAPPKTERRIDIESA